MKAAFSSRLGGRLLWADGVYVKAGSKRRRRYGELEDGAAGSKTARYAGAGLGGR